MCDNDEKLQEKYALLQTLCKQQIILNETLKSELSKLGILYQKVLEERRLLLNELIENRSPSSYAVDVDNTVKIPATSNSHASSKRTTQQNSPDVCKKSRLAVEWTDTRSSGNPSVSISENHGDYEAHHQSGASRRLLGDVNHSKWTSGVMARPSASRLQNMATRHNAAGCADDQVSSASRNVSLDGSPPSFTVDAGLVATRVQKGSPKTASLLSHSSFSGSTPLLSVSHSPGQSSGFNSHKNNQVMPGSMNRAPVPVNVLRNPAVRPMTTARSSLGSVLQSTGSSYGPRILIQPSSTNIRPVLLKATESLYSQSEDRP